MIDIKKKLEEEIRTLDYELKVQLPKEILKARLVVDNPGGTDRMTLQCEVRGAPPAGLAQAIEDSIRSITKLRGEVAFKKLGELPNDGRAIEDAKKYD